MRRALAAIALWLGGCTSAAPATNGSDYPAGRHAPAHAVAPQQAGAKCPPSTYWDGYACVWRYVVTDVRCPAGSRWIENSCVASTVVCPAGARWTEGRCVLEIETTDGVPRVRDDGDIFETRTRPSDAPDPFEYQ